MGRLGLRLLALHAGHGALPGPVLRGGGLWRLRRAAGGAGPHVGGGPRGRARLFEKRGYVTKFSIGMLTALAVAAAGNTEHVGSKTERFGDYTIRTDYYRVLTEDEMAMRR